MEEQQPDENNAADAENGGQPEVEEEDGFETACDEQMEQNTSNDSESQEDEMVQEEDDSGKENVEPHSTPIADETPAVAPKKDAELMPAPPMVVVQNPTAASSPVSIVKAVTVPKLAKALKTVLFENVEQKTSSVSDPGSSKVDGHLKCFRCVESFHKEKSFRSHMKHMHNIKIKDATVSDYENTPGKFVRAPTKRKQVEAFDDDEEDREIQLQDRSPRINPMKQVKRQKKKQ